MAEQSNNTGKAVAIILIIVFVLAALVGAWYWFMYKPEQEAKERARQEQLAREKAEQERLAQEQAQNQLRYDKLILDADSLFILRRWENARSLYIDALAILPDQTYPRDQITLINSKLEMSAGEVETITERTGRFYVIISSSLDDDLAMDYAKKLSDAGNNVKVVEHQMNKNTYFGVSLGDYDTWDQAVSATLEFNSYGEGVWVLKW